MAWTVETLNDTVNEELSALPDDMRARFVRIAKLIEAARLPNVGEPHVKHIRGGIWEIRLKARPELPGLLRYNESATCRGRAGFREEDANDAEQ